MPIPVVPDAQPLQIVPTRAAAEYRRLPTVVRRLARLCDGTRTLAALRGSGALPADEVDRVVGRLVALGVVAPSDGAPASRRLSPEGLAWIDGDARGFSEDEEQFFSSSIDHLVEDV